MTKVQIMHEVHYQTYELLTASGMGLDLSYKCTKAFKNFLQSHIVRSVMKLLHKSVYVLLAESVDCY